MKSDQELVKLYRGIEGDQQVHENPTHVAGLRRVQQAVREEFHQRDDEQFNIAVKAGLARERAEIRLFMVREWAKRHAQHAGHAPLAELFEILD